MRLRLTERFCASAKPKPKQVQTDYFDELAKGLALRASTTHRGWVLFYRWNGKLTRLTLGSYPATGIAAARTKALEAKRSLAEGRDPRSAQSGTFAAICDEYLRREGSKLRTLASRESLLRRLVLPILGPRRIEDIQRSEIIRCLDRVEDEQGPVQADRTLGAISRIMNWHASRSDSFRSPIVRGMARTKPKERARDRVLSDEELRAVWKQAEANGVFGAMICFILLTAARRSEVSELRWSEIDGTTTEWTLPAERNKTKVELVRPLSKAALEVLPDSGCEWVFAVDGKPITAFSRLKQEFDKACGVGDYVLHDLRRTSRSLMSRAGVDADIAERCLGHVIPGVRGVYDRHEYYREKQRAYELLAGMIDRIVKGDEAKVVSIGERQ
jgi:integrase